MEQFEGFKEFQEIILGVKPVGKKNQFVSNRFQFVQTVCSNNFMCWNSKICLNSLNCQKKNSVKVTFTHLKLFQEKNKFNGSMKSDGHNYLQVNIYNGDVWYIIY